MKTITDKGGDYEQVPEGNHIGRVHEVIFLGTVSEEYKGVTKATPKIRIGFELAKKMEDGRPFTISTFPITASMNSKAKFRKLVQGIVKLTSETEKEFDPETLIGKECLVNVIHNQGKGDNSDKTYENVAGCSPLPEGTTTPELVNEAFVFDINSSPLEDLERIPEFVRNQILGTPEYLERVKGTVTGATA